MRALFYGIAISAVAGLSLGALAQPDLSLRYRSAPQTVIPTGAQAAEYGDAYISRSGPLPDYVIGTDWVSPPIGEHAEVEEADYAYSHMPPEPDPVDYAYARPPIPQEPVEQPEPEPVLMPSMGGGVAPAGYDGPEPPAPPQDEPAPIEDPWLG